MHFDSHGIAGGIWRGTLTGSLSGRLCIAHEGEVVAEARATGPDGGPWQIEVELPGSVISDGITSLLLLACEAGMAPGPGAPVLGRLDLRAGQPLAQDVLAEIALLRAELELMKREFRRLAAGG
ncbi:MAG: hypothetical protein V7673_01390 [Paracoccus sp. (in: a-proteobacteria)]|uniref:hypothetical protein n=1 Tax=Paracoccus sp. TaxID=267 RepID=UPI00300341D2